MEYKYCEKCVLWVDPGLDENGVECCERCGEELKGKAEVCVTCSECGREFPKKECFWDKRAELYLCEDCESEADYRETVEMAWRSSQGMKNKKVKTENIWRRAK